MKSGSSKFILKKIYLILSHGRRLLSFMELLRRLQVQHIVCEAMLEDEEYKIEQDALYITDSVAVLERLSLQGLSVVVYLHEDNRTQDFSAAKYAFEQPESIDEEYLERVFRRCQGIAWDILETDRCYLRETIVEDVDAFYDIYKEPVITRYTENLYENKISERAYILEYIEKIYGYYEFGIWTVILKETGEIIGRAGLSVREGYELPELGYVIGVPWQGKGIAQEVCQAILGYAREEYAFEQVQVLIQRENEASVRLAKKLGFQIQDTVRNEEKEYLWMIRRA